jgi:hypothetical protein
VVQLRKLPTNAAKLEDAVQLQTDAPTDVSWIEFALDPDLACVRVLVRVLWVDVAILRLTPDPDTRLPLQHPLPEVLLLQNLTDFVGYGVRRSLGSLKRPHACARRFDVEVEAKRPTS